MSSSELLKLFVFKYLILTRIKNFKLTNCKNNKRYHKIYELCVFKDMREFRLKIKSKISYRI